MSPEARERSFDELASGLASGSLTRGKALRLMGAALLGGVLASGPGVALAAPTECTSPEVKCRGKCVDPSSFNTERDCGACGNKCPVSCVPAFPGCQEGRAKGRVQTVCDRTTEGETTCLANCQGGSCSSSGECPSGMVCSTKFGRCLSRCAAK